MDLSVPRRQRSILSLRRRGSNDTSQSCSSASTPTYNVGIVGDSTIANWLELQFRASSVRVLLRPSDISQNDLGFPRLSRCQTTRQPVGALDCLFVTRTLDEAAFMELQRQQVQPRLVVVTHRNLGFMWPCTVSGHVPLVRVVIPEVLRSLIAEDVHNSTAARSLEWFLPDMKECEVLKHILQAGGMRCWQCPTFAYVQMKDFLAAAASHLVALATNSKFGDLLHRQRVRMELLYAETQSCLLRKYPQIFQAIPAHFHDIVFATMELHADSFPAIKIDFDAGRTIDVLEVNGFIQSIGRQFCIPTPVTDALMEEVHSVLLARDVFSWNDGFDDVPVPELESLEL